MFISKQVEDLERSINNKLRLMESQIANHISKEITYDFVECEKCGCLLNRKTAIKGSGEIRKKLSSPFYSWYDKAGESLFLKDDYIYYPFYCKIHQPKAKK